MSAWDVLIALAHKERCNHHVEPIPKMPPKGEVAKFKNYVRKLRVPFVIYDDFESLLEHVASVYPQGVATSKTETYQRHTPSGFAYVIKYKGGFYKPITPYTGPNAAETSTSKKLPNILEED